MRGGLPHFMFVCHLVLLVALSFRDVEEILYRRGICVTYEAIRYWCRKFGQTFANAIRRQRNRLGDTWHVNGR